MKICRSKHLEKPGWKITMWLASLRESSDLCTTAWRARWWSGVITLNCRQRDHAGNAAADRSTGLSLFFMIDLPFDT